MFSSIGRFIINPQKTGQGFGKAALKEFLKFLFSDKNIESVTLTVFASISGFICSFDIAKRLVAKSKIAAIILKIFILTP